MREIRVLRYFLAVAREGSITDASHFLHVTQPSLSRQLKELEDKLGKKLFVRKSHHMALTKEGMILRKRAEEIIDKVADTSEESHLCFRPLEPKLASGVRFVWKKHQVFSQAAHLFFSEMEKQFSKHNGQGRDN
ncbi:LysR family transcriptional regulator [Bacillus pumilus]|nr:LysR family transcriptional regulator [Bacillus pumilus]